MFFAPKTLNYLAFNLSILSVPDEGYSRNVPDEGYSRNVPDEGYSRNNLHRSQKIGKQNNLLKKWG
jgi:hypothetical protein